MALANTSLIVFFKITFPNIPIFQNILVVSILISFLFYIRRVSYELFFFKYKFDHNGLNIKSGIFYKKDYCIHYKNILGGTYSQPLFYRFFSTFSLTIFLPDTGDNKHLKLPIVTSNEKIYIDRYIYNYDIKLAKNSRNQQKALHIYKPVSINRIIYSSLFSLNYFYAITIFFLFSDVMEYFKMDLKNIVKSMYVGNRFLVIIFIILFISFSSILKQYLSFSQFKLYNYTDSLEISNGVLKKETLKMKKKAVKGVLITTSIGQRFLHLSSVKAILLNSKNKESEVKLEYILPYQKKEDIKNNINEIFYNSSLYYDDINHYSDYIYKRILIISILISINFFNIFQYGNRGILIISFVIIATLIGYWLLNSILSKFKIDNKQIQIHSGILVRRIYLLEKETLEWKKTYLIGSHIKIFKVGIKVDSLKKFTFVKFR